MRQFYNFCIYLLKREPYYHKIQYSKVSKYDTPAAVFGVVIGAFVVYLSLSTLGSASPDLSDLTVFIWYVFIFIKAFQLNMSFLNYTKSMFILLKIFLYNIFIYFFNYGWGL